MDTLQMRGGGEKKPGSGSHRPEAGFRGDLHANSSAAGLPIEILAQALDCGPPTFIADVNGNISYTNTAFKQLQFDTMVYTQNNMWSKSNQYAGCELLTTILLPCCEL